MKRNKEFLKSEYMKCMLDFDYFKNNYIKFQNDGKHSKTKRKITRNY